MIKQDFENFLNEQLQAKEETKTNWREVKKDWIKNIDKFYDIVEELLAEYLESGKISYQYIDHTIYEEQLGSYKARKLSLTIGQQQIDFIPIARLIFGGQGRIDLEGTSGTVKFIYTVNDSKDDAVVISILGNSNAEKDKTEVAPVWRISTPPPHRQYIDINKESFFNTLMEVVNG